jgi:uncharacterized UPF0160 family protein
MENFITPVALADSGHIAPPAYGELRKGVTLLDETVYVHPPSISQVIADMNPPAGSSAIKQHYCFMKAGDLMSMVLENTVAAATRTWEMREAVLEAPASDGVLVLPEAEMPWDSVLPYRKDYVNLLYVVSPSERGGWLIQQVPLNPGSYEGRKRLPVEWGGLRGKALAEAAGLEATTVDEATCFVHVDGFVGGMATKADALALVAKIK